MIDRFVDNYWFLSNFSPSVIVVSGISYPTVEHGFQAAKSTDPAVRARIAALATPGEAKRAGRRLDLRPGWDGMRIEVMRWLLGRKFAAGSDLAAKLVATGAYCDLVEGNDWGDRFWGVADGRGENWLGRLLMERRSYLLG